MNFIRFSVNFTLDACSSSRNVAYHFKTDFINNKVIHNYKTVDSWNEEIIEENTWIQGAGKVYAFNVYVPYILHTIFIWLLIHIYRLHLYVHMYRVLYWKALDFIWKIQTECRGVADYHWNPANTRNSILRKSFSLLDFVQVFVFTIIVVTVILAAMQNAIEHRNWCFILST